MSKPTQPPSSVSPLMLPIQYEGQIYFTSQYFHQAYRQNCGDAGKYAQLQHFNRLIRSIETYKLYVEQAAIVELTKDEAGPDLGPAFKANFGKPLMLINATAQVALTHHLDDEISKRASVGVNMRAAREALETQETKPKLSARDAVYVCMMVHREMRKVPGVKRGAMEAATLQTLADVTGVPAEHWRHVLPEESPETLGKLTPTQIGKGLGLTAREVNVLLLGLGWQRKNERGDWELTQAGLPYGEMTPYARNGHTGYQALWYPAVVDLLRERIELPLDGGEE